MSKALKTAVGLASRGKQYSIMPLTRSQPELAAVISKLIPGREPSRFSSSGELKAAEPNLFELNRIHNKTARDITDAETVMQMLPETDLAATILISCTLSPKDMMTVELTYTAPEGTNLPPDVVSSMTDCLRQYFETDYKISPLLPTILRDVLVNTGSYAVAVIPENAVDEVINNNRHVTMESLSDTFLADGTLRPTGVLRNPDRAQGEGRTKSVATETLSYNTRGHDYDARMTLEASFGKAMETFTSVIDNPHLLKVPQINQKIREQRITQAMGGIALEKQFTELHKLSDRELTSLLYKSPRRQFRPIDSIATQERLNRRTVGSPLVMHFPSESVIPAYVPGNVKQQVGFFVLIDQDGHPLTRTSDEDLYGQMSSRMTNSGGSFATAMLNKVQYNTSGFDCCNRQHLDYAAKIYGTMVEQDLLSRLRNGHYANGVALANKPEVYRLMLARALAQQHTQVLFLPIELMTYFAFRYNNNGVGRSILDEMKILSSLRAMLTFADTMAAIKNSIGKTKVDIKLDETDPDPQKTIERYLHEIAKTRQMSFPIGVTSPVDITDYMQRAQFEFGFSGHPKLPDTSVEFTEKNTNYVKTDTELRDDLRKRAIQKFGLPAQVVDNGYEADFATAIATQNILIAKNVIQLQDQLNVPLEDHLHKVAINDETLVKKMRQILEENYDRIIEREERIAETQAKNKTTPKMTLVDPEEGEDTDEDKLRRDKLKRAAFVREQLYNFMLGFHVSLPRPNSVSLQNQKDAFDKFMEAVDAALNFYFSTDILSGETLGDVSNYVDVIKNNYRSYLARKWMAENGMLPELAEMFALDEDGKPKSKLVDINSDHIKTATLLINEFMDKIKATKFFSNKLEQKRQEADNTESGVDTTTSETPTSGGGDGGGGDGFGFDDGGLFGGEADTESTTEETTEETTSEQTPEAGSGTGGTEGGDQSSASGEAPPGGGA